MHLPRGSSIVRVWASHASRTRTATTSGRCIKNCTTSSSRTPTSGFSSSFFASSVSPLPASCSERTQAFRCWSASCQNVQYIYIIMYVSLTSVHSVSSNMTPLSLPPYFPVLLMLTTLSLPPYFPMLLLPMTLSLPRRYGGYRHCCAIIIFCCSLPSRCSFSSSPTRCKCASVHSCLPLNTRT